MTYFNFIAGVGLFLIVVFIVLIFLIPEEQKSKKRKQKAPQPAPQEEQAVKQWQSIIERHERHIVSLKKELEVFENKEKEHQKEFSVEKLKAEKLQEKLVQERGWHGRETKEIDKATAELHQLKAELKKVQEQYTNGHNDNLKLDREIKEQKRYAEGLLQERRDADAQSTKLSIKLEEHRKEILQLKHDNAALAKKTEDSKWVAKTEHDELLKKFRELERELERIKREIK